MGYKTWFVYDKETGYILSGFDYMCNPEDGYNPFNRPYKYPEFYSKDEHCRLDTLYTMSVLEGLKSLKKENMVVTTLDQTPKDATFVKNPNYFYEAGSTRGWWKLNCIK